MRKHIATSIKLLVAFAMVILGSGFTLLKPRTTYALPLMANRFDRMSSNVAGANATHVIGFTITQTATPLGSVGIEFCANDPLPGTPCTAPTGFTAAGASLGSQTGNTGFSIHPSSTANKIILGRFPVVPIGAASTYQFNNVINPSSPGTYFVRLQTFSSNDGTGGAIEEGGIAIAINDAVNVSAEVPPYLKFCTSVTIVGYDCSTATSFFIDLGEFSTNNVSVASSEFVVATNAGSGLTITMTGTTLTSGNNTIQALNPSGTTSPGTSQFGVNLRANNNPGIGAEPNGPGTVSARPEYNNPNSFRFVNNESIATTSTTSDNKKFTLSYLVNISDSQPPGVYATTLSFICLANF